jgi:hypothetical protein
VARPDALAAVKERLLRESGQTLVVSAIAGLGGLGKSVLATAIVLDEEVRQRFEDGILWVTLGQNPDLLGLVGEWIRELDKSRESFSATTLESASGYLHNLLAEKRVLLVVDDVWNADHADWFRVGGAGCRVLVTTREAEVEGADYYPLDLMSEEEAIALVWGKLKRKWDDVQAAAVKRFARVVGYLPLALDLSVNLVRDGVSWGELQAEFEDERRAVALELLDASEAFENLPEERRRKYSLKACFNLSLKRLNPEQLRRFAWLGVLPEDVRLDARMVRTLWGVSEVMAKRGLIELFRRSFLTSAGESIEGYSLYRVHDLMHDTARGLIEGGCLGGVRDLAEAHGAFVDRYGAIDYGAKLCGLPNDGYVHRHLTWHLVMAAREEAVHELLGASDGAGRNAWFEACEEIGEPAVFVQDVKRGWELAEALYDRDPTHSITLQCRYALIIATTYYLLEKLSGYLINIFINRQYWTVERAWAYFEQASSYNQIFEILKGIVNHLSSHMIELAMQRINLVADDFWRSELLCVLISAHKNDLQKIQKTLESSSSISHWCSHQHTFWRKEVIRMLEDRQDYELSEWIKESNLPTQAEVTLIIQDILKSNYSRRNLKSIQNEIIRARLLRFLALDATHEFTELIEVAKTIRNEFWQAWTLRYLSRVDDAIFVDLWNVAQAIKDPFWRLWTFREILENRNFNSSDFWSAIDLVYDKNLNSQFHNTPGVEGSGNFSEHLEYLRSIQDSCACIALLPYLATLEDADIPVLLHEYRLSLHEESQCKMGEENDFLENDFLLPIDFQNQNFEAALVSIKAISYEYDRARLLRYLIYHREIDSLKILDATQDIENEYRRADILKSLANKLDLHFLPNAMSIMNTISHSRVRADTFSIYLPILPLHNLPYPDWRSYLHLLSHRKRADLMRDLETLHPVILHLGGEGAMRGIIDEMKRVCQQWP